MKFIEDQIEEGNSVVFMMNLSALVQQTIEAARKMKIPFRVVAAEYDGQEFDHQAKLTICMQQTLYARIDKIDVECDVLVVDEFHRSFRTDTMEIVKKKLSPSKIAGVSATVYDEKGYALRGVDIIETKTIKQLTNEGFLTPLRVYSVEFAEAMDYSESGSGEYSEQFLNGKINNDSFNEQIVKAWHQIAKDKKTIVFCTGIAHSEALAEQFQRSGVVAYAYHSKLSKKDSKGIMEDFTKNGGVLCSVGKVLVGFDDPSIQCGIAARPTKTRRVWQQACGRMIRLFDNKKEAILLDCAQWTGEHGFYDYDYAPPEYGDKEGLKKAKADAAVQVMTTLVNPEPTLITADIVLKKVAELERKRTQIPELQVKDLLAIYETSQSPTEILRIAAEMNFRKTGQLYNRIGIEWISEPWDIMLEEFPQYSTRILKTLRTMSKSKVSQGKKLKALHFTVAKKTKDMDTGDIVPGWLRRQVPYCDYNAPDSVTPSDEVVTNYEGIDDDEIPF